MDRLYRVADDFEAVIRILPPAEGGRQSSPRNGIRWDFCYADDDPGDGLFMIWPDFHSVGGASLAQDMPLPVGVDLAARMTVLSEELRTSLHRARIKPGVEFYCFEGSRRVAHGRVTQLTGLHKDRERAP